VRAGAAGSLTRSGRRRPPGRTASPAGRFHVRRRWHVAGDARGRPSPRSPDVRLRPVLLDSRPEGPGMSLPRIEVNSIRSAGASAHSKPAALWHPCLRLPPTPSHGATGGPSTGMMCPGIETLCGDARGRPSSRSPDVRLRPPGFSSLEAGCALASMPALAAYAVSRGDGRPLHRNDVPRTSHACLPGETDDSAAPELEARGVGECFPSGGRCGRTRRLLPPASPWIRRRGPPFSLRARCGRRGTF